MSSRLTLVLLLRYFLYAYGESHFPNFNVMGAGYNAMMGNPNSYGGVDPGYSHSIFQQIYNSSSNTCCNGSYIIPIGFEARETFACTTDFSFTANSGMSSYQKELDVSASLQGSIFSKVKFRASTTYKSVESEMSSSTSYTATTRAQCFVYEAYVDTSITPPFTTNFIQQVKDLPTKYNNEPVCNGEDNAFASFIAQFGTHLPVQIQFGCIFGENTQISSYSYAQFSSSNLDIATAASYHGIFVSASASTMTTEQKKQANAYGSVISNNITFSVGSDVGLLNYNEWAANCKTEPQPVMIYQSEPIQNIINSHTLPQIPNVDEKASALQSALYQYCECLLNHSYVDTCSEFAPAPPIAEPSIFGGMYTVADSGSSFNTNNPYTSAQNCEKGFKAYRIWSSNTVWENTGDVHCMYTYICLNQTIMASSKKFDPMGIFGGGWSEAYPSNGFHGIVNPLTNDFNCPSGYQNIVMSNSGDNLWCGEPNGGGARINLCLNLKLTTDETFIGGLYTRGQDGYENNIVEVNPYTGAASCPEGFTSWKAASYFWAEGSNNYNNNHFPVNVYLCLSNIY